MNEETFGQRLRRLRKKHGFTQAELAFQIGVHEITIRRWESGERPLENIKDIKKLASILQVSEDELLNGVPAEQTTWVLHVEIGDKKETYINMATLATKPISTITTTAEAGYLQLGGGYQLWTDDTLYKKMLGDFKKLRAAVIANGRALGGIKDEETQKGKGKAK